MRLEQYLIDESIRDKVSHVIKGLRKEGIDSAKMMKTFFDELKLKLHLSKKQPTDKELQDALHQLKDVGKLSIIAGLFLISSLSIPVVEKIANHYHMSILPDGFK